MQESEEARKRLRVDRLRRQTVGQEIINQTQPMSKTFSDPSANEWDKMNSLKQIEMIREANKTSLLSKVLKESMASKQKVEITPGQPSLIHFLVQNPFPQDQVFQIIIADPDAQVLGAANLENELQLVHNEKREWQYWASESKC